MVMAKGKKAYIKKLTDPVLEPYFIQMDELNYTLCEAAESGSVKVLGYYSSLGKALEGYCKSVVVKNDYSSVKDYITEYNKLTDKIKNTFSL